MHDRSGRLLLIRRGQPPGQGLWSLPGGRVEPGESDHQAVVREIEEETGLRVRPGRLLGTVRRPAPSGATYVIADYACELVGPDRPTGGSDADEARWVDEADYYTLPLVAGLTEALIDWGALPAR
nr:NUDIX domain-containing protein [Pseudonocardia acaciae]